MFAMIIVMAACGVWIEMRIVNSCSPLGDLLERTKVGSALFSLGLSVLLGMLFGAAGLIVFVSGILSTVIIQPWYAMRANGSLAKVRAKKAQVRQNMADTKDAINAKKDVYARRANQVADVARVIGMVIALPFIVFGKILDAVDKATSKIK